MGQKFHHMGLEAPFGVVNKLLKFCDGNLCPSTTVNLNIDLPIFLSWEQPYWSINRQDVRLKSSPIFPQGLIGAEGQETCMYLLVYCLYGSNKRWWMFMCASFGTILLSCFPFQNLLFLFFYDTPQNKFKCLLSSSNQTVRDILENKWNKMLCD